MLDSIISELRNLGREVFKSLIGTPGDTAHTAIQQVTGEEVTEAKIKENAEKEVKFKKLQQSLHEQAQELGITQNKPQEPSDEELKAEEEAEKKKKELPPLEVPHGKITGEVPVKRAQTQIEDKQGYKG